MNHIIEYNNYVNINEGFLNDKKSDFKELVKRISKNIRFQTYLLLTFGTSIDALFDLFLVYVKKNRINIFK